MDTELRPPHSSGCSVQGRERDLSVRMLSSLKRNEGQDFVLLGQEFNFLKFYGLRGVFKKNLTLKIFLF